MASEGSWSLNAGQTIMKRNIPQAIELLRQVTELIEIVFNTGLTPCVQNMKTHTVFR